MLYILARTVGEFCTPSTLLVVLSSLGLLLTTCNGRSSVGLAFLAVGVGGVAAVSFLPVGTLLMRPLEDRFPAFTISRDHIDGIIVLGGAIGLSETVSRGEPSLNDAAGRMTTFIELAHRYPAARLLFTGGDPSFVRKAPTEADVARSFFAEQGMGSRKILFEKVSRNTRENALYSKLLVRPPTRSRWLLVTSAADIPRAVGSFRAIGWPVIAYPTDYHTVRSGWDFNPGLVLGFERVDWATHEWIGLLYYKLMGWSDSLFPKPKDDVPVH